mmetsp:Transcript_2143/g.4000  ORF Transcript_2143/g.4000 Transcript_2143/m.4000 type:complete len:244 (-) Transcript_2143:106-837(-)|eukprot:CAMPEP_0196662500 /NCGR_PEP_ID=MMETSP1086-20130531/49042_1 /TAXON_ID=77921 /ORGANISM="Cyanoptyche  gloeocystis , Strain SAG4.97" /LENGTH=243 /DNA_ID=CAMNT_0041997925 /DNA_START=38 /DNA_END=769 /DNA_ORIENTATION=-
MASLGWLTESSILPKKRKKIDGLSASSIIDLKAILFQAEEDAKRSKSFDQPFRRARKVTRLSDTLGKANSGVSARNERDEQMHAEEQRFDVDAALRKKAQLYDRIARGEFRDSEERFLVDFDRKQCDEAADHQNPELMSADMKMDQQRTEWEKQALRDAQQQHEMDEHEQQRRGEEHVLLQQICVQTRIGRDKHVQLRVRRREAAAKRLEKIMQRKGASSITQLISSLGALAANPEQITSHLT